MVDNDDRRTPDHGHPISSPCEPNGSGELKSGLQGFEICNYQLCDFNFKCTWITNQMSA